jgi:hypothetical protein
MRKKRPIPIMKGMRTPAIAIWIAFLLVRVKFSITDMSNSKPIKNKWQHNAQYATVSTVTMLLKGNISRNLGNRLNALGPISTPPCNT